MAVLPTHGMTLYGLSIHSQATQRRLEETVICDGLCEKGETQAQNDKMIHMGAPGKVRPLAVLCSYHVIMQYGTAGHGQLPDDNI